MIELLVFLVLLVACSLVAHALELFRIRPRQSAADKIRSDLFAADQKVATEFHRTRRAMNEAAGQDWRNLAG
ncbi:hypothetical protein K8Z61_16385 [Nocardioides sp. TRM66260-LWL]|uniref:hypothetical protein n=1 Tax=Nocardioides sp. TRM66260-LWL TaxID=2874478 RepID=UPI001CC3CD5D|nr:hypothetical protein [Nocardioides sp. TRM66260-LWL]MBZ5736074.1 hypothetical protein [Nocardioides sp. TRM66260-LWL]